MSKSNYTEKYIRFRDNKLYVRISGEGEPILLLHGLGADHTMWSLNYSALNRKFKIYALDLPGFGKSDKPDDTYSISFFVEAVRTILEAEGLKKVRLIGASLGGRIALETALNYPDLVDKIILVAPAGISRLAKGIFGSALGGELMAFAFSKKILVQKILAEMVYEPKLISPFLIDTYLERAKDKKYLRAFKKAGYALGADIDNYFEKLPKYKGEVLIIWGEDDKIVPIKDGYYLHKLLTNSKLVIFSQCGHLPFMEKTVPFNKLILDFFTINSI